MNKKIIAIPIIVIIGIFLTIALFDSPQKENNLVFHITLAEPSLYGDGVYFGKISIKEGEYYFRFVPNGSSPEILTIQMDGKNFQFEENFQLKNTLHQTGISEYYTWEYEGQNSIIIPETQDLEISINPNGNVMGSVSVDILEK